MLCGLLTPSRGCVRWKGEPVAALREEYARQLVYLGHAPAVKGDLTADGEPLHRVHARRRRGEARLAWRACALRARGTRTCRCAVSRRASGAAPRSPGLRVRRAAAVAARRAVLGARREGIERLERSYRASRAGRAIVFTTHQDPRIAATRTLDLDRLMLAAARCVVYRDLLLAMRRRATCRPRSFSS